MKIFRRERSSVDTAREQRRTPPVRFCKTGCPGHTSAGSCR